MPKVAVSLKELSCAHGPHSTWALVHLGGPSYHMTCSSYLCRVACRVHVARGDVSNDGQCAVLAHGQQHVLACNVPARRLLAHIARLLADFPWLLPDFSGLFPYLPWLQPYQPCLLTHLPW